METKIAFMGAGSKIFAKNVLGDCMLSPALCDDLIRAHGPMLPRLK